MGKRDTHGRKPWMISGGFEPDCPLCRAMEEEGQDLFGARIERAGVVFMEVEDLDRLRELFHEMEERPGRWMSFPDA